MDRGPDATTDATTDASSGAWLERWFSLRAPAVSLPYASRRRRARGTVTVQGDATLANDTLWQGGVRAVGLALSAGLFWALFAISLARRIETSASRDISQRVRAPAPGADASPSGSCGLESVDQALVDARRRVDATVEEQNARIESLQSEIHRDAVTWLPNRKYFMDRFRAALSDRTAEAGGHLLMFRQRDLAQINRHLSRAFTDQWLRSSADRLRRLVDAQGGSQALLARIGGSDFALLMPRSSAPCKPACWPSACAASCARYACRWASTAGSRWALAMAEFAPGDGMSDTLARLDHALMCSESADDDQVAPASQAADSTRIGEYSWHDALTTALEQHKFALAVQALQDVSGGLLHHEASLTLHDASGADPDAGLHFHAAGGAATCRPNAISRRCGWDWTGCTRNMGASRRPWRWARCLNPGSWPGWKDARRPARPHPAADHRSGCRRPARTEHRDARAVPSGHASRRARRTDPPVTAIRRPGALARIPVFLPGSLAAGSSPGCCTAPAASIWPPRSRRRLKRWAWPYTPRTCRTQPRNPFWRKSASTPCAALA